MTEKGPHLGENPFESGENLPYSDDPYALGPGQTTRPGKPVSAAKSALVDIDGDFGDDVPAELDYHNRPRKPRADEIEIQVAPASRYGSSRAPNYQWGDSSTHDRRHKRRKNHLQKFKTMLNELDARHAGRNGRALTAEEQEANSENRQIYLNLPLPRDLVDPSTNMPYQEFGRNKIRTTKYTPLSFLPKNILFQFQNVANIYFMFIVILGAFPIFGVENPGLAAVPICVIVGITAVKDAIEDYRRTVLDLEVNNTLTEILHNNENPNVVDENISYWRRFKKACTRMFLRVGSMISNKSQGKRKQAQGRSHSHSLKSPFGLELADNTSTYSRESIGLDDINTFDPEGDNEGPTVDSVINRSFRPVTEARFKRDYWKNVKVGDFVRVRNDQEIPADMVVLSSSEADSTCFVETKNLDGETNLKIRQALRCGSGIRHARDCQHAQFWIDSEGPLPNLYSFNGVARWRSHEGFHSEPITINNMLLRGTTLRNTDWVIGVVIFTGMDTKIMLNAGITPTKRSRIQIDMNLLVIYNFGLLFVLCFISGIVNGIIFRRKRTSARYFEFGGVAGDSAAVNGIVTFWSTLILYQSLVPISLYISIEIVKTIQAFFIYSDCYMYYEPIDYPCTPKSWNISDDLGQIEYIFSDKTGTLTQNVMEFKKCTVNGVAYGKAYTEALAGLRRRQGADVEREAQIMKAQIEEDKEKMISLLRDIDDNSQLMEDEVTFISSEYVEDLKGDRGADQAKANYHFMLALALCNSVITEASKKYAGRNEFKAQSPDEAALVSAARDVGFTLAARVRKGVIINIQGTNHEFEILNIIEFTSSRKRMSVIARMSATDYEKPRILLICKGADSVIYDRLLPNVQESLRAKTAVQLEEFANEGLRTLCLAERELSEKEYSSWNERYERACASLQNREEKIEQVSEEIEKNLTLLGGTAIEDRLQDGVPRTISVLSDGGIKLWVLTGDKVETAINIGFSCNLLDNQMELLVIKVENGDKGSVPALIDEYLYKHFRLEGSQEELMLARGDHSVPTSKYAIIIDGDALKLALNPIIQHKFLLLCKQCRAVMCCRVSPAQKAAVVRMVRNTLDVITLAIGDGANDVAMIQEANVGVGIAGEEGRQAVMSSDYAIGQFRFLARLLLVHGRYSYRRLAEMVPNFFYKNVVFTLTLFWYGIANQFDGSYLYEYTYVMFFNLAFTSLPIILMGIMDQDVPDKIALAVPQLYRRGILRIDFTEFKFWMYMFEGLYQSFVAFFFPYFVYCQGRFEDANGRVVHQRYWMGLACCSIAVCLCNIFVLTNQYRWDWISLVVAFVSSVLPFWWSGVYTTALPGREIYKAGHEMYGTLNFWAVLLLGIVCGLLPHFIFKSYRTFKRPMDIDIIREQWKIGEFDPVLASARAADDPEYADFNNPYRPRTHRPRRRDAARTLPELEGRPSGLSHGNFTPDLVGGSDIKNGQGDAWDMPLFTKPGVSLAIRKSLDEARRNSRWEQPPVRDGLGNVSTTHEIEGLPIAEGLMQAIPDNSELFDEEEDLTSESVRRNHKLDPFADMPPVHRPDNDYSWDK